MTSSFANVSGLNESSIIKLSIQQPHTQKYLFNGFLSIGAFTGCYSLILEVPKLKYRCE